MGKCATHLVGSSQQGGTGATIFLILLVKRHTQEYQPPAQSPKARSSGSAGVQVWVCLMPELGFFFSVIALYHLFDGH